MACSSSACYTCGPRRHTWLRYYVGTAVLQGKNNFASCRTVRVFCTETCFDVFLLCGSAEVFFSGCSTLLCSNDKECMRGPHCYNMALWEAVGGRVSVGSQACLYVTIRILPGSSFVYGCLCCECLCGNEVCVGSRSATPEASPSSHGQLAVDNGQFKILAARL